jgi:hypothetical protein
MQSRQQVTMLLVNRIRAHSLLGAAVVTLVCGCGCSSAGKASYLRHLNASIQPSMVSMQAGSDPDGPPRGEGERMVASAASAPAAPAPAATPR